MNKLTSRYVVLVLIIVFVSGCFGHSRHKKYTFDQKFEYHFGKVMKSIKKVVSNEGKLERIEKKILAHKIELKGFAENIKKNKKYLLTLLIEANDKELIKGKLREAGSQKIDNYNRLIDLLFEVKAELSEEEWTKVAVEFKSECSHWWK